MARWLVISDVHANMEALDAVLRDAERRWGALRVACAGDIVGLGPSPNECIGRLREREAVCVAGNHDLMVLRRIQPRCTPAGLRAVEWTRAQLSADAREWLEALPTVREAPGGFVLCHGSLEDPDEYVVGDEAIQALLRAARRRFPGRRVLIHGHTHHPVWAGGGLARPAPPGHRGCAAPGEMVLVNPGSVGQSRTREARARYVLFDTNAGVVEYHATAYDTRACLRRIRAAGLETRLYRSALAVWRRRFRRLRESGAEWVGHFLG